MADSPNSTETSVRCRAEQTEVTLRSRTVLLDFTGECRLREDGDAVRLTGLRLSAELPDAGGPEDGGTVVLEQEGESGTEGREVTVLFTASVRQPGGQVRLTTEDRARWTVSTGPRFEPAGDEVRLVLAEAPDTVVLSVRGLALRVDNA
ncbi:hypothetical protein [Nocardia sp. NRRL S-836]|uniref:hypothetical protein n=1 Tax=Nocardia sp. NRRL S-836 TaxID=1519492 RepID=UPI0006AF2138|nr:hypothetical protein [Nocardia sp. NRRL S-836]KOV90028.1 hypothetical protein ADL03_01260 [Nocardia sp. NRRL S-836]